MLLRPYSKYGGFGGLSINADVKRNRKKNMMVSEVQ
jgi:hypothetical protein